MGTSIHGVLYHETEMTAIHSFSITIVPMFIH